LIAIIALFVCATSVLGQSRQPSIALRPFATINASGAAWIGNSVVQSLQADLRNATISRSAADFVVSGNIQVIQDQVRLIATVVDRTGATVTTAKATGDLRHLFDLEDSLANQIRDGLARVAIAKHPVTTPIPDMPTAGPLVMTPAKTYPIGTVAQSFSSPALRDGRDRYIYQVPCYGCWGGWGYGCGWGGYGCGWGGFGGGVFNGSYSTGGQHSLAW
jgi:TolB-like protein